MNNKKLAKALKTMKSYPINKLSKAQRKRDFKRALLMRGIKSVGDLSIRDLDRVYLDYKQLNYLGSITDYTLTDICNAMLGHGLDSVIKKCHYGRDIWITADRLY